MSEFGFSFDNTYARELEGFFAPATPATVPAPRLLRFNSTLAERLNLNLELLESSKGVQVFSGNLIPAGAQPLAQAYAGHQFGGFSPQLGDGRAILLGEVVDSTGQRLDVQLKGSGRTPFSRRGDGKSALGPVLREYLVSEAMHQLGVPTSRALACVATGESVFRETELPGGVLTRVAKSHLRIGTFEFFAARGETERIKTLADYSLKRHYPERAEGENPYLGLLTAVSEAQASLVADWMRLGFIHGVMNTDNMTISGETIDFGPCAFLETYFPMTVFSSIDSHGRYAYANQPGIASWNLARLAETLLPLIDEDQDKAVQRASEVLENFAELYRSRWLAGMTRKIGLPDESSENEDLVQEFLDLLEHNQVDFTLGFRVLSSALDDDLTEVETLFGKESGFSAWSEKWLARLGLRPSEANGRSAGIADSMNQVNPLYIPRNHKVEEALSAAVEQDDLVPFERMMEVLAAPFIERPGLESWAQPAPPDFGPYRTFCGT